MRIATLLLALLYGPLALADPAHVQTLAQDGSTGNSEVLTYAGAATVGNRLVGSCVTDTTTTITGVSDSVNGAWSAIANTANLAGGGTENKSVAMFSFGSTGAGTPAVTFSLSHSDFDRYCFISEYSDAVTLVDSDTADFVAAGDFTCASSTAGAANEILVAVIGTNGSADFAPNNSETERGQLNNAQAEDKLTAGAGSVAATWDIDNTQPATCSQAIYAGGVGGGGGTAVLGRRWQ